MPSIVGTICGGFMSVDNDIKYWLFLLYCLEMMTELNQFLAIVF